MMLAPVKESIRQACKGEVYDMLYDRVRMQLAERGERVLKKRAERLAALFQAMVEQAMRDAAWPPRHIATWCSEWCGVHIDVTNWTKIASKDWELLQQSIYNLEEHSYSVIAAITVKINRDLAA